MKAKEIKIVTPKPYLEVSMGMSNRRFYSVRNKLWELAEDIDGDYIIRDAYISEKCDYEGDLEKIIIYNGELTKEYVELVKKEFGIKEHLPEGMDLVFTV